MKADPNAHTEMPSRVPCVCVRTKVAPMQPGDQLVINVRMWVHLSLQRVSLYTEGARAVRLHASCRRRARRRDGRLRASEGALVVLRAFNARCHIGAHGATLQHNFQPTSWPSWLRRPTVKISGDREFKPLRGRGGATSILRNTFFA